MTRLGKTSLQSRERLLPDETRAAYSLAALYALRMLGLFLILPVFALYAEDLRGATPLAIGIALGVYGLTQAALQIPFGLLSDRLGRKPVIMFGLLLFALGSAVAALSDHIGWVIAGRALQGAGAIAAAVMALAADLSREEQRAKVMGIIGVSIGLSFAAALLLGPLLSVWIGVDGIFALTALLALGGIVWTHLVVPTPTAPRLHRDTQTVPSMLGRVLRDAQLLRLDGGIFLLHLSLTATFVALPLALRDGLGLAAAQHWRLYLPALLLSIALMIPIVVLAEKKRRLRAALLGSVALLGAAELLLGVAPRSFWVYLAVLTLFFTVVNYLEASLPALVTRLAPADAKGTALGAYSTCQFLGAFSGGALAGWAHGVYGLHSVFLLAAAAPLLWLLIAWGTRSPRHLNHYLLRVGAVEPGRAGALAAELLRVDGVAEAVVVADDGVAYLKIDKRLLDKPALLAFGVR